MFRFIKYLFLIFLVVGCTKYTCEDPLGVQGSCSDFAFDTSVVGTGSSGSTLSYSWDFSSASDYTYESPISVSSGVASVSAIDTDDDDNTSSGFGGGTLTQTEWDSNSLGVTLAIPSTDEELPASDSSSGYVDMSNTGILLHMNEDGPSDNSLLTDSGGENLTATLYTGDGTTPKSVKGVLGNGIYFDGSDYIAFNEGANGIMDESSSVFTYMMWFKPLSGTISSFTINGNSCVQGGLGLWGYWSQPLLPNQTLVQARVGTNGVIIYELKGGWVSTVAAYEAPITDWTHIALVSEDASNMHLYINGKFISTAIVTANTRELNIAQIGSSDCAGGTFFHGSVDEFAVLTRALSATEVATVYNAQKPENRFSIPAYGTSDPWFPLTSLMLNVPFDISGGWDTTANAILDRSGNSNHLTAATANDVQMPGQIGQGAYADKGSNGYYVAANETNFDFEITSAFSLAAWFRTKDYGGGTWSGIMGKVSNGCGGGYPAGHTGYWLQMNHADGAIYWTLAPSVAAITMKTSRGYNDGQWHHIVATYDGSQATAGLKFYLDGVEDSGSVFDAGPAAGTLLHNDDFVVGSAGIGCNDSMDQVDEVAVWTRELTQAEAEKLYRVQASNFNGIFKSRVMDGANTSSTWSSLSWETRGPSGKNLPNSNGTESAYDENNVDASTALLLYHFDETSGNVIDSSSSGEDATPTNVTQGELGKLNRSAYFDGTAIATTASTNAFQTSDFTVALWLKIPTQPANPNAAYIVDTQHFGLAQNFTILCGSSTTLCGMVVKYIGGETGSTYVTLQANRWQHLAFVKEGTAFRTYLDGIKRGEVTLPTANINWVDAFFCIGGLCGNSQNFIGSMDEFVMFGTPFSNAEVKALYDRSASTVLYQVRSCNEDTCSSGSFAGPDGTGSTYYSELNNSTVGFPSNLSLSGSGISTNRYFQYRALFLSDLLDTTSLPFLKSASVSGTLGSSTVPSITVNSGKRFSTLTGFQESKGSNNNAMITYQVSTDGGSTWYWYSGGWRTTSSGSSESSSASVIHSNITTLPTGSGNFKFKAFLNTSNGTQTAELSSVSISGTQ